jgi:hypothetical protein
MTTILVCMLLAQASPEAKPTMKAVPRRIVAESLTTPAGTIKPGSTLAEVMAVLGPKAKPGKVKKVTANQLLAEGEYMANLESSRAMFNPLGLPRISVRDTVRKASDTLDLSEELANRCELCDAQLVVLKVGSKEELRVMLMGPSGSGSLTAQMVIYGRERSKPEAWRESPDGGLDTVTEDGARLELRGGRDLSLSAK